MTTFTTNMAKCTNWFAKHQVGRASVRRPGGRGRGYRGLQPLRASVQWPPEFIQPRKEF